MNSPHTLLPVGDLIEVSRRGGESDSWYTTIFGTTSLSSKLHTLTKRTIDKEVDAAYEGGVLAGKKHNGIGNLFCVSHSSHRVLSN